SEYSAECCCCWNCVLKCCCSRSCPGKAGDEGLMMCCFCIDCWAAVAKLLMQSCWTAAVFISVELLMAVLRTLKDQWQNTPPSRGKTDDACGTPWEGVTCENSTVTGLVLSTMGLVSELTGDIGGLTELKSL
ncbi:unnamed protein product, partial [Ilex paraguariensis]